MEDPLDQAKADAFAEKLLGILNGGALALMISIGHRTGLFDTLAGMEPTTSEAIASRSKLQERYVREWLNAMVVGGIVEYEAKGKKYFLPKEHAAYLCREAAPNNMAAYMQYIPLLGEVEEKIIGCFQKGGGVPYSAYPRFHEVMAEDSGQTVLPALINNILPLAEGLVDRLKSGLEVLDLGCGRGRALMIMARHFPKSRFTGYDLSEEAMAAAREEASSQGLLNLNFSVKDVTRLGEKSRYDLIIAFDAIHDQARPDLVLKGIYQALRPGGIFLMQDIKGSSFPEKNLGHPLAPFLYTISTMHCMTVSLAQGGMGLGTLWGREKALQMLGEAGFTQVEVRELPHDLQNDYYLIHK